MQNDHRPLIAIAETARGAHAARVPVWAARPNRRSPFCLLFSAEKLGEQSFRRAAENSTPAACAPQSATVVPASRHLGLTLHLAGTISLLLAFFLSLTTPTTAAPAAPAAPLLKTDRGRAFILQNGKPLPLHAYNDYIAPMTDKWKERIDEFIRSGETVFFLNILHPPSDYFDSPFWTDDGVFPTTEPAITGSITNQARFIIERCPTARFYVRATVSAPLAWTKKRPGEVQTDDEGNRQRHASISSPSYLDGLNRSLRNVVSYCEAQPWNDRIIGYLALPYGEGLLPLTLTGKMFDCSAVNQQEFRAWVKRQYADQTALRKAWGNTNVTFDTVAVPRDQEWKLKRTTGTPTLGGKPFGAGKLDSNSGTRDRGLFHWIEPVDAARELDYCRFERAMFLRWLRTITTALKEQSTALGRTRLVAADVAKQPLMGWQILSAFDGVGEPRDFPNVLQLSGSWDQGELLDDPTLDALWTPADYHARTVGFAWEPEGPADSMVLRGKTMLAENDARSWVGQGAENQGAFLNPIELEAGLLRNEAMALSRNFHSYWCNVGSSYFHDPKIQEVIARIIPMLGRVAAAPHRETTDAIAFIIDDTSPMYEDLTSGFQSLAVIWQRIQGLAHCGVPYRIYLLSDLRKDNFPEYKVFFFPNLFRVDDDVLALLRKKVLRDGHVAIFGPGTGITDGQHLTAEPATRLLGVKMELVPRTTQRRVIVQEPRGQNHPIVRELSAGHIYGDTYAYGPTIIPADKAVAEAKAASLGWSNTSFFINRPGLFLRENGRGGAGNGQPGPRGVDDYAVLWSCAIPLPAELLRAAARQAGCNIWSEENDVIYASDTFVSIHAVKAGKRILRLPRTATVRDAMTGAALAQSVREVTLELEAVQTRMLLLE